MTATTRNRCSHHKWQWLGGCDNNPGVVSIDGGWYEYTMRCTRCGLLCQWRTRGNERTTTTYFMPETAERKEPCA